MVVFKCQICGINDAHNWPLAVFMASDIWRRQAWSVWWTTLVAHFRRSASCTVSTTQINFAVAYLKYNKYDESYADAPFVQCRLQLDSAGRSVQQRSTPSPSGWGQEEKQIPATNKYLIYAYELHKYVLIFDNSACLTCHNWTNHPWCWVKRCLSPMSSSVDLETPNASPSPVSPQWGWVQTCSGFCWCRTPNHTADTPGRSPANLKRQQTN